MLTVVCSGALSWCFYSFPTFGNLFKYLTESKEPSPSPNLD